jgi:hypothetical protein
MLNQKKKNFCEWLCLVHTHTYAHKLYYVCYNAFKCVIPSKAGDFVWR